MLCKECNIDMVYPSDLFIQQYYIILLIHWSGVCLLSLKKSLESRLSWQIFEAQGILRNLIMFFTKTKIGVFNKNDLWRRSKKRLLLILPVDGRGAEAMSVAVDFWIVGSSTTFTGLVVGCCVLFSVFFVVFGSS